MSRKFFVISLYFSFLVLGACRGGNEADQIAEGVTQALRVPVFIWAFNDDACVRGQIQELRDEYERATPARKKDLVRTVGGGAYEAIILHPSAKTGTAQGRVIHVQLLEKTCEISGMKAKMPEDAVINPTPPNASWCEERIADQVLVSEGRTTERGTLAESMVKKGKLLEIIPTSAVDQAETLVYSTYDSDLFQDLIHGNDRLLRTMISVGKLKRVFRKQGNGGQACGRFVTFDDIEN